MARQDRKNEIKRLKNSGRDVQTLAANIDRLFIIDSIYNPPLRTFFIDRMIFSADVMNIPITIVINKIDLIDEQIKEFYNHIKEVYTNLGIDIIETSAE
ncbi:MAG: GTPase RsgA, partial [Spirochaetales bacterium]|nr:GTPase RsgA [Spirochaetales bacterium]